MDSVPDSPPAQGPHPAAPSPGDQSGRHGSESPVTALWAGGTPRQALPGRRVLPGASLGCFWQGAGMPGRVGLAGAGAGMRSVFPAPAPLINKGS